VATTGRNLKVKNKQSTSGESNEATIYWCEEEPETAMALPMVQLDLLQCYHQMIASGGEFQLFFSAIISILTSLWSSYFFEHIC